MAYSIVVHEDAWKHLEELWEDPRTEDAAAEIEATLEELQHDQLALDALTVHDFGHHKSKPVHVSKWVEYWRKGADIWRLKIWSLEEVRLPYRIVYAYEIKRQRYHVLAVLHRDFDYDRDHPATQRILEIYAQVVER